MQENTDIIDNLVSIITPAYNSSKYIEECIESVLNQTYQNWEMLIVNDHSTDNTQQIVEEYIKKDNRIKLYNQKSNRGVAFARNTALELSKGRYVAFLDSDDTWKPKKLEVQLNFMLKNNYGFTFTSYETINSNPNGKKKIYRVPHKINYNQYIKNTIIGNLTVVMDKKLLGEISVEYGDLEDVLTWMKYLKMGYPSYGLNENLACYRITKNSVSNNKFKNAKKYFWCLRNRQNLSVLQSIYCQFFYLFNATKKRLI
ncbi:glycosyltransferase family 2 protein [Desemzia sp. RIT804]|uniref:glycosyltransferase family 2 protein n=1 Tax=Desemzia sp. RIT 804 TaxID=2810209 RepID=UPI00194E0864|nr:glycosyltransferase family 2 protein [Desemzia sp. RIT 804]MBM6615370.1 glycosyltransferase family 2 protein [Desemzia sp. RIT 804]